MNERLRQLEQERQALEAAPGAGKTPSPVVIHPNLAELYRRRGAELEQLLADPELGMEAMDLIRSMITHVTVRPRIGVEGVDLELEGDLARILWLWTIGAESTNARAILAPGVCRSWMPDFRWLRGEDLNL